jgi:hypothetical protein
VELDGGHEVSLQPPAQSGLSAEDLMRFIQDMHAALPQAAQLAMTQKAAMWHQFVEANFSGVKQDRSRSSYGKLAYRSIAVVQSLLLSDMLRHRGDLKTVLEYSARFLLRDGSAAADTIIKSLQGEMAVPAPSTLSRWHLHLHVGWCRRQREINDLRLARKVLWNAQFDSSPQGFKDWLMCCGYLVVVAKLGKIYLRSLELSRIAAISPMLKSNRDQAIETSAIRYIQRRNQPLYTVPVALGSKRSAMPYKFHAATHSCRLITSSWKLCCVLVSSMASLITDLGVERLLPRFPRIRAGALFPWAFGAGAGNDEGNDEGNDDGGRLETVGGYDPDEPDIAAVGEMLCGECGGDDDSESNASSSTDNSDNDSVLDSFSRDSSSDDGGGSESDIDARVLDPNGTDEPIIDVSRVLHAGGPHARYPWHGFMFRRSLRMVGRIHFGLDACLQIIASSVQQRQVLRTVLARRSCHLDTKEHRLVVTCGVSRQVGYGDDCAGGAFQTRRHHAPILVVEAIQLCRRW